MRCLLIGVTTLLCGAVPPAARPVRLRAADGVALSGVRYRVPGARPAILFHGLASNRHSLDGLARHLAARGADVWCVDLRGPAARPAIDDYALRDVPAAIGHVRRVTGRRPFVVGHSMGGMILYAYLQGAHWIPTRHGPRIAGSAELARRRQAQVCGLVTICSPPRLSWPRGRRSPLLGLLAHSRLAGLVLRHSSSVPVDTLSELLGAELSTRLVDASGLVLVPSNVERRTRRLLVERAAADIPARVARQFLDGIRRRTFREFHVTDRGRRPYVYAAHLDRIRLPALVLAASRDRLVDPATVRDAGHARLGSADRTLHTARGFGHVDLLVGRRAAREVYPVIDRWLAARR